MKKKQEHRPGQLLTSLNKEHKNSLIDYEAQIKELKSQNAHLQHLLFGRSTEKKSKAKQDNQNQSKNTTRQSTNRNRGHQPGTPGHGRRKHENLPVDDVEIDLPESEQYCATCRLPFNLHPGTDIWFSGYLEACIANGEKTSG